MNAPALIYGLCLAASAGCGGLLARAYLKTKTRLLLWTAISFCFFALNNLVLVLDMLVLPDTDLWLLRQLTAGAGVTVLLLGFVWEMR